MLTAEEFDAIVKRFIRTIVGMLWMAFWGFMLWLEMKDGAAAAHKPHVYLFAFLAIVGALIADPGVVKGGFVLAFELAKNGIDACREIIPKISFPGRKSDDDEPEEK